MGVVQDREVQLHGELDRRAGLSVSARLGWCLDYAHAYTLGEDVAQVELLDGTAEPPNCMIVSGTVYSFREGPRLSVDVLPDGAVIPDGAAAEEVRVPGFWGTRRVERRLLQHAPVSFGLMKYAHLGREGVGLADGCEAVARLVRFYHDESTREEAGVRDVFDVRRTLNRGLEFVQFREHNTAGSWKPLTTPDGSVWRHEPTGDELEELRTQLYSAMKATKEGRPVRNIEADTRSRLWVTARAAGRVLLGLAERLSERNRVR